MRCAAGAGGGASRKLCFVALPGTVCEEFVVFVFFVCVCVTGRRSQLAFSEQLKKRGRWDEYGADEWVLFGALLVLSPVVHGG